MMLSKFGATLLHTVRALLLLSPLSFGTACAQPSLGLQYLGNEGVAVFHNGGAILFDPLFRNDYGTYVLVPETTRESILAAKPPFDRVTAVFVSHYHGDHFDPADILALLETHRSAILYAPQQAVDKMIDIGAGLPNSTRSRMVGFDIGYDDKPQVIESENLLLEAYFVPHSGWPTARTDVQNIAFRVVIADKASVAHLGDSDPNQIHFTRHDVQWQQHETNVALPPYWFFNSKDGNKILGENIRAAKSIGIHVPASFSDPEKIPDDLREYDLFIEPGESRLWPARD